MVRNLHDETHTFTLDAHESLTIPLGPYNGGWDEQHEWYRRDLKGFGVRSWRELPGQVWQLRVTNQATGSQTYVSSEKFCVEGQWWQLDNGSDATIHYRPSWDVDSAIVTAAHRSAVRPTVPTQGVSYGSCGMILSSDFRTLSYSQLMGELDSATQLGGFSGRLIDDTWQTGHTLLDPDNGGRMRFGQVVAEHRAAGLDVWLWMAPHVLCGTGAHAQAEENGWLVHDQNGEVGIFPASGSGPSPVMGSYLDFTNADLVAAWLERLEALSEMGISGVKLDFGEALPDHMMYSNTLTLESWVGGCDRNRYVEAVQHVCAQAGLPVVVRSGWTHSPTMVGMWAGDQSSDLHRFAGARSTIEILASAAECGWGTTLFDIGGYFGTPTEADMARWIGIAPAVGGGFYHGLGNRNPADGGPAVRQAHVQAVKNIAEVSAHQPDFYDSAQWHFGHHDTVSICQRSSDTTVVGVGLDADTAGVWLSDGMWMRTDDGELFEGNRVVTTNMAPTVVYLRQP